MRYLALLTIVFSCAIVNAQNKRLSFVENTKYTPKERNAAAAFLSSAVFPGGGQMYNGQVGKGIGFFAGSAIAIGLTSYGITLKNSDAAQGLVVAGSISFGILYLVQLFDAPLASRKINKKIGYWSDGKKSLSFNINPVNPSFSLNF
jgi:hypothetical protein